ncbi:MAG: penicillin-binding transpeptidase domain-containing protein [Desulfobacteraceae bacterium]
MNRPNKQTSRPDWREYQRGLNKRNKSFRQKRWAAGVVLSLAVIVALAVGWNLLLPSDGKSVPSPQVHPLQSQAPLITKKDVQILLHNLSINDLTDANIVLPFKSKQIHVETSLDPDLQQHLIKSMDRKHSRYIGIVVMEADTGRILAMAGFNKIHPENNPCYRQIFPAASVFKIVTAAAAVDHCGYTAQTPMHFNGYKHTLYKNQLKERSNRYTNTLSFRDAFAQSVNPIFGKLGTVYLGKSVLEEYAVAFGFNQPIQFELPVEPSTLQIKDKPYNWAEVASGFNNDTAISPLHGAMMASAVLNDGLMVMPTLVDRIEDPQGRLLYERQRTWRGRAMTSKASKVLTKLMETTVRSGTGRKAFRHRRRDRVLSQLRIGGKTGNIFNRAHDARFDWFVGFAEEKSGPGRLVFAALVAHEEYIGIRPTQYARMVLTRYFKSHIARHDNKDKNEDSGS